MSANQYVPIRVSTLRGNLKIPFDAYVTVASKHILFCRKGDSFEGTRLERLRKKKLKKMFILEDHENAYRDYITQNIEAAYNNESSKTIGERSEIIQGSQQAAAEDVMDNPTDETSYQTAKEGSSKYVEFLLSNDDAIQSIIGIENTDSDLAHHGVTVATLAVSIAKQMNLAAGNAMMLEQLTLGCLLHDFEHHHNGAPYNKHLSDMSEMEKEVYLRHCKDGADRVKDLKHFDELVIKIILQHEETINGTGFPQQLTEKALDPMVLCAATANAFDRYMTFNQKPKDEAIKLMMIEKMGLYPLDMMKALKKVIIGIK